MAEGTAVVVNFDALAELVKRMQSIHDSFDSMGTHPPVDSGALGDVGLADELERFLDGWSQGRQLIAGTLMAVVAAISNALATYEEADHSIASIGARAIGQPVVDGSSSSNSGGSSNG